MDEDLEIRSARPGEEGSILGLIRELAAYEKLLHEVVATEEDLATALFGESPSAEALVGLVGEGIVAFALFFTSFSTFEGKSGLYLEDLFVKPEFRRQGIGKKLLAHLAKIAVDRGCRRFEWAALDWNESAIRFYEELGAQKMEQYRLFRITGTALEQLATSG